MVGRLFTQMELFGVEHVVYEQNLKNLMESMYELELTAPELPKAR